jgi:hypothetical protein
MLICILVLGFLDPSFAFQVANVQHPRSSLTAVPSGAALDLGPAVGSNTELWLDLRGTRLFPSTALQRLEEDLGLSDIVDRIVLWDDGNDNNKDSNFGSFVFVDASGDLSSRPPGKVTGRLLSLAENGFTDPLAAMETNAKGGWVLVDSKHISDNDVRMSGVNSLVELLVAGSAGGSAGVLVLGEPKKDSPLEAFENGGIAWTCATKADVFHAAATLQALQSSSTTTSSGILVASAASEVSDVLRLQSAVVLPFDELLWATAAIVFRGDER